jgi:protein-tyrosine phosphatase
VYFWTTQEPLAIRRLAAYRCFPILDGAAPDPKALSRAVGLLRPGPTFVHCAHGHARTGLFALAAMLKSGAARTIGEGLEQLTSARPAIHLTAVQRQCIAAYAANLNLASKS